MSVLKLLTLPQVAKIIDRRPITVYYHIRSGHLAATKMAGLWLVRESAAYAFKAEREANSALRRNRKKKPTCPETGQLTSENKELTK